MGLVRRPDLDGTSPVPPETPLPADRLTHRSAVVRRKAAAELAGDPTAVPALLEAFGRETERGVIQATLDSLIATGGTEVVRGLVPYLRVDDAVRRNGAIEAMREHLGDVVALIPELLRDPDPDVRILTLDILQQTSHPDAEHWICIVLREDDHPNVIGTALDRISMHGTAASLDVVEQVGTRFPDDPYVRFAVTDAIETIRGRA